MIPLVLCSAAGVAIASVLALHEAWQTAVDGYEDADGFHAGPTVNVSFDGAPDEGPSDLPPVVCG